MVNPYRNDIGDLHLNFIRTRVGSFFDNPATVNPSIGGDAVFTYSTLNTVVRFFPWNVLEYSSFRPIGIGNASGFVENFSVALAFIQRDSYVINEIYLAGYEQQGRQHVFWFNYIVGGFPLIMPEYWHGQADPITAPIEVVVDYGHVVRYRRIAYQFHMDYNHFVWANTQSWYDLHQDDLRYAKRLSLGFRLNRYSESELLVSIQLGSEDYGVGEGEDLYPDVFSSS